MSVCGVICGSMPRATACKNGTSAYTMRKNKYAPMQCVHRGVPFLFPLRLKGRLHPGRVFRARSRRCPYSCLKGRCGSKSCYLQFLVPLEEPQSDVLFFSFFAVFCLFSLLLALFIFSPFTRLPVGYIHSVRTPLKVMRAMCAIILSDKKGAPLTLGAPSVF